MCTVRSYDDDMLQAQTPHLSTRKGVDCDSVESLELGQISVMRHYFSVSTNSRLQAVVAKAMETFPSVILTTDVQ